MSVKTAVAVLVVAIALFVAAIVVGARQDEGTSTEESSLAGRFADVFGDPSAVDLADVSASCADEDQPDLLLIAAGPGGGCRLAVRNGGQLRLLGIRALDDIEVVAPAPEGDLEFSDSVAAGELVRLAVGEGETDIGLTCPGVAGQCRARLVPG